MDILSPTIFITRWQRFSMSSVASRASLLNRPPNGLIHGQRRERSFICCRSRPTIRSEARCPSSRSPAAGRRRTPKQGRVAAPVSEPDLLRCELRIHAERVDCSLPSGCGSIRPVPKGTQRACLMVGTVLEGSTHCIRVFGRTREEFCTALMESATPTIAVATSPNGLWTAWRVRPISQMIEMRNASMVTRGGAAR